MFGAVQYKIRYTTMQICSFYTKKTDHCFKLLFIIISTNVALIKLMNSNLLINSMIGSLFFKACSPGSSLKPLKKKPACYENHNRLVSSRREQNRRPAPGVWILRH